jgi:nucleoside-diphosphate-sugar epimerase
VPTALVTGATGLVGNHVVLRLAREGWTVRALVRDAARAGALSRAGVDLATGDTLEPTGLARAARGCDVVFHAAAAITPRGGWDAFNGPNVQGTRNAIAAAAGAKARLVHVSSVAVYGEKERYAHGSAGRRIDEESPLATIPETSFYARSKRESEQLVLDAHVAGRLWATAVRPCVVYGPHDRQFVPRVARLLQHGVAPLVNGGRSTLSIVHAANVADGMLRAAQHDGAGGRTYNLANDFDVTVAEFVRLAGIGMGLKIRALPVPLPVAKGGLAIFQLLAPLVLGNRFGGFASSSLDFLSRDNPFSSDRARRELGWAPPVRPEEGIPDAFRWWAKHH